MLSGSCLILPHRIGIVGYVQSIKSINQKVNLYSASSIKNSQTRHLHISTLKQPCLKSTLEQQPWKCHCFVGFVGVSSRRWALKRESYENRSVQSTHHRSSGWTLSVRCPNQHRHSIEGQWSVLIRSKTNPMRLRIKRFKNMLRTKPGMTSGPSGHPKQKCHQLKCNNIILNG